MGTTKFEEFLSKVTSKVKSKEAHSMIKNELTNHLQELSQSFQKREFSKEDAQEKAIQEMGNPFTIGEKLNQLHKPRMDWALIFLFAIMASFSFLLLGGEVVDVSLSASYYMGRQAIWYILAVLVIIGFLFFDYRKLKNWWMYFYGGGLLLHFYIGVFGIEVNGAQRWISLGGITLDGTAITLFLFFLAWTGIFNRINEFNSLIKQVLLFLLFWIPIFLFMTIPHFMVSIIYFFSVIAMFTFSHVQKKLAIKLAIPNILMGIIIIGIVITNSISGELSDRLLGFINPEADPQGAGYLYIAIHNAISQAGWFGNNSNDIDFLGAPHTDFAFPYLVYSLGWIVGIALCLILLIFIARIAKNAFKTRDHYGRLLVIGSAALVAVPACWNILMCFGIVPIMEVSLPFISYGGTMLLINSALLGLTLSVYRRKDIVEAARVTFE
ncbi:FtsW/RodA/SpoVE family cell cycle protein [Gracilibacillus oryzae]|uniref:FtsW/RodA/SpoVE family cell cycle protein n=1 Tax=Gracilibacillus oryzae TaxID=1672701 RepID=A0A7C8KR15_9BACI|nr:FtsW/RodA/SpoVE family cell cycle protein [Gracilibacillus oryzae]KAB8137812.1 FtsW/RodA/SpoVE family cell cycle protein [Gracilibacillus oryzae]